MEVRKEKIKKTLRWCGDEDMCEKTDEMCFEVAGVVKGLCLYQRGYAAQSTFIYTDFADFYPGGTTVNA